MKMISSIIIDLRYFVRRRDFHSDVSASVGRSTFSRYGPSDLALPDQFWIFSHGCREEYYHRNICSGCYVLDNGDSCSRLPSDVDQAVPLLFLGILARVHVALVLRLKLKLWKNLRCYFQVYGSVSIFGCLQESTRLCHGRRKSSKIC
jgi:hypothetical protein